MASITLFAPVAMATTELARTVPSAAVPVSPETPVDRSPLRMSWVVAVDGNGMRRLRMDWTSGPSNC